jgi:hypothetical protein
MTAPMVLIELALMGAMYSNKTLNILIATVSALTLIAFSLLRNRQRSPTGNSSSP